MQLLQEKENVSKKLLTSFHVPGLVNYHQTIKHNQNRLPVMGS